MTQACLKRQYLDKVNKTQRGSDTRIPWSVSGVIRDDIGHLLLNGYWNPDVTILYFLLPHNLNYGSLPEAMNIIPYSRMSISESYTRSLRLSSMQREVAEELRSFMCRHKSLFDRSYRSASAIWHFSSQKTALCLNFTLGMGSFLTRHTYSNDRLLTMSHNQQSKCLWKEWECENTSLQCD